MKAPIETTSIPAALARTAGLWPERGVHYYDRAGVKSFVTWRQVLDGSRRVAWRLGDLGVPAGERALVVLPGGFDFIYAFFGALMAGVHPVPLPPPRPRDNLSKALGRLGALGEHTEARTLITLPGAASPLLAMAEAQRPVEQILSIDRLTELVGEGPGEGDMPWMGLGHDDVAYIQCTSGATGPPKAVRLTHGNLLANVTDIGRSIEVNEDDVGVSWLPMIHDMGLVGVLLFAACWGVPLVALDPERFLKAPHEWLWAFNNHGGTLSPASNFGYHYCARRARRSDLEGLDLSSWRVAMNGSETLEPEHLRAFERRFSPFGLRRDIMTPVYGLAEGTVAVTFGRQGQPLRVDRVDRERLTREGLAAPAPQGVAGTLEVVSVGAPLPSVELSLRNDEGREVGEREVGQLHVKGRSVCIGYCNPEHGGPDDDGWMATGDLAYLADGEVFVLGRLQETINLGERTLYPCGIESLVAKVEGVRPGGVAAFGVTRAAAMGSRHDAIRAVARASAPAPLSASDQHATDAIRGPELLILGVEASDGMDPEAVGEAVLRALHQHCGLRPDDVRVLTPRSLPRTATGKIQRTRCRDLYLEDRLDRRQRLAPAPGLTGLTERARSYVTQMGRRFRSYFGD